MSDMIFYKNGEETFRISPPTVGTKCPETKLEVKKMTNKEQLKAQIQELQEQLQKLEEISPVEEAYKRVYGAYPPTTPSVSNFEDTRWSVFQAGYNALQKSENEQQIKELIRESVKWCEEHPDESVEDYLRPKHQSKQRNHSKRHL